MSMSMRSRSHVAVLRAWARKNLGVLGCRVSCFDTCHFTHAGHTAWRTSVYAQQTPKQSSNGITGFQMCCVSTRSHPTTSTTWMSLVSSLDRAVVSMCWFLKAIWQVGSRHSLATERAPQLSNATEAEGKFCRH